MMNNKIRISTSVNGPLIVKYLKQLTESNGNIYPINKLTVTLCRCGESKNKPFCDRQQHRF